MGGDRDGRRLRSQRVSSFGRDVARSRNSGRIRQEEGCPVRGGRRNSIPNLGEKKYVAVSDAGVARQMKSQVCEVNKALLSVHRCVQAGNKVVFAASGSYIQDETSDETMPLTEKWGACTC